MQGKLFQALRLFIPFAVTVFCVTVAGGQNAIPAWWFSRGVVNTNATAHDYAAANLGQLKWFATNAFLEFDAHLPGGAGPEINNLVLGFSSDNNFTAINLGQMKAVAVPFHQRLIEIGIPHSLPWPSRAETNDFALANLGQLKNVFCFSAESSDSWQKWPARPGFTNNCLEISDDGYTHTGENTRHDGARYSLVNGQQPQKVDFGFRINFDGNEYSNAYINCNGNITFDVERQAFDPDLITDNYNMIAPFWGDVDTRFLEGTNAPITYSTQTVSLAENRMAKAFGVTWDGVGYFSCGGDKTNTFQLVLIDRSDIQVGDFDLEFNYYRIQWETGGASGGSGGLGGSSAHVGFDGTNAIGFELVGSGITNSFIDTGSLPLASNSLGTTVQGRYLFHFRDGVPSSSISGKVWYDANGDGRKDSNENGLAGLAVYSDQNSNGIFDSGETIGVTDSLGWYNISVTGSVFREIRVLPFVGAKVSFPTQGYYSVIFNSHCDFGLYATNALTPDGMANIPAGEFQMGNMLNDQSIYNELPVHTVNVNAFFIDKTEVPWSLWNEVRQWAVTNGYDLSSVGAAKGDDHPVHTVSWYNMLKWCNARSQKEWRTPCYTNANGEVYKTGDFTGSCSWLANGYRLPTEAEWEKAGRGGASGMRFPWSDTNVIAHTRANYRSSWSYPYDVSDIRSYHPDFDNDPQPYTSPVGSFAPNGYGLYDMSGNVCEWCWDVYTAYPSEYLNNPHNDGLPANSNSSRVMRGGAWSLLAVQNRVATRLYWNVNSPTYNIGFRTVISSPMAAQVVSGIVWNDFNANRQQDYGEEGLAGITVFIDKNEDGFCNVGEAYAVTDVNGKYVIPVNAAKQRVVRVQVPQGLYLRYPENGVHRVVYSTDCNFGLMHLDGMVTIPAGSFQMGDSFAEMDESYLEQPVHTVYVSTFFMCETELTFAKWQEVSDWAVTNGYDLAGGGLGKAGNHPVHSVTWYNAIKWCNAYSQKIGRTPCYTNSNGSVYKTGDFVGDCNWAANGYRLPTEAEWEKAARGGVSGMRFPWSDANTIGHARANYDSAYGLGNPYSSLEEGPTQGLHPDYYVSPDPFTSPVRSFSPNGYGLYDMSGNVDEWCWDMYNWYGSEPVSNPHNSEPDPFHINAPQHILRGGYWCGPAIRCRVSGRTSTFPTSCYSTTGFRPVINGVD